MCIKVLSIFRDPLQQHCSRWLSPDYGKQLSFPVPWLWSWCKFPQDMKPLFAFKGAFKRWRPSGMIKKHIYKTTFVNALYTNHALSCIVIILILTISCFFIWGLTVKRLNVRQKPECNSFSHSLVLIRVKFNMAAPNSSILFKTPLSVCEYFASVWILVCTSITESEFLTSHGPTPS